MYRSSVFILMCLIAFFTYTMGTTTAQSPSPPDNPSPASQYTIYLPSIGDTASQDIQMVVSGEESDAYEYLLSLLDTRTTVSSEGLINLGYLTDEEIGGNNEAYQDIVAAIGSLNALPMTAKKLPQTRDRPMLLSDLLRMNFTVELDIESDLSSTNQLARRRNNNIRFGPPVDPKWEIALQQWGHRQGSSHWGWHTLYTRNYMTPWHAKPHHFYDIGNGVFRVIVATKRDFRGWVYEGDYQCGGQIKWLSGYNKTAKRWCKENQ